MMPENPQTGFVPTINPLSFLVPCNREADCPRLFSDSRQIKKTGSPLVWEASRFFCQCSVPFYLLFKARTVSRTTLALVAFPSSSKGVTLFPNSMMAFALSVLAAAAAFCA